MTGTNGFAIRVLNLSKMFKMYSKPADMFWELLTGKERHRPFWALRDVTFDVLPGQVVGIMGRNGAGKSTLLKIVTGTLDHTGGSVSVQGRVSSILELGTGFNAEYSGRENIYLGGLMVGLTRDEILSKMDWIVRFSELEDFIDQPFKTYSTGMQARLTFSTAVCIDPDILIVDEALSVGDARFQRKSFGKIEEFRKAGRTILLVSHDPNTISTFCDHAILLENGKIFDQGEPQHISKVYYRMLFSGDSAAGNSSLSSAPEDQDTEITLDCSNAVRDGDRAWRMDLSAYAIQGDSIEDSKRSRFSLYEDEKQLRPGHYAHDLIRKHGKGGYSHWGSSLYFSTSDNSDPRKNGRIYRLRREASGHGIESLSAGNAALRNMALKRIGEQAISGSGSSRESRMGNGKAEILDCGIWDQNKNRVTRLTSGVSYTFFMRVLFYEDVEGAVFGFAIRNLKGVDLFGTSTRVQKLPLRGYRRGDLVETTLTVNMGLANATFFLSFAVADPYAEVDVQYDQRFDALPFEITRHDKLFETSIVTLDAQMISESVMSSLSDTFAGT
jgi:ABC-type polysaccharide/polyol phosphate transport system ATPase subunit